MRQKLVITKLLQSVTSFLQSTSGITKCDSYCKVRCNTGKYKQRIIDNILKTLTVCLLKQSSMRDERYFSSQS